MEQIEENARKMTRILEIKFYKVIKRGMYFYPERHEKDVKILYKYLKVCQNKDRNLK